MAQGEAVGEASVAGVLVVVREAVPMVEAALVAAKASVAAVELVEGVLVVVREAVAAVGKALVASLAQSR